MKLQENNTNTRCEQVGICIPFMSYTTSNPSAERLDFTNSKSFLSPFKCKIWEIKDATKCKCSGMTHILITPYKKVNSIFNLQLDTLEEKSA